MFHKVLNTPLDNDANGTIGGHLFNTYGKFPNKPPDTHTSGGKKCWFLEKFFLLANKI